VPKSVLSNLEEIKGNEELVMEYGTVLAVKMCNDLIDSGVEGLHFYTCNRELQISRIIDKLGLSKTDMKYRPPTLLPQQNCLDNRPKVFYW
jgi:5,10-methylenetetrahydrofolate reductase